MGKPCNKCGVPLHWTAFEVDAQGNYLRDAEGRAVVHGKDRCSADAPQTETDYSNRPAAMPFGKYRGKTVAEVAQLDADYLVWARGQARVQWLIDAIDAALSITPVNQETAGAEDW